MKQIYRYLILLLCAVWIVGSCTTLPSQKEKPEPGTPPQARSAISVRVGDMDFHYAAHAGASLSVHGVPILADSNLYVVQPGWVPPRYYGMVDNPFLTRDALIESYEGGKRITLFHELPSEYECPFKGREIFTLLPDNTYSVTLEFVFEKDAPAQFQWSIGSIFTAPFVGADYTVRDTKGTRKGMIPFEAEEGDLIRSAFAMDFYEFTVASRLGEVSVLTRPEDGFLLSDYRKNRYAERDNPTFWLGNHDSTIKPFEKVSRSITLRFPKEPAHSTQHAGTKAAEVSIQSAREVFLPKAGSDYIIPTPKYARFTDDQLLLSAGTKIFIGKNPGENIEYALRFFLRDLKELYDIEPQVIRDEPPVNNLPVGSIFLGETPRYDLPAALCSSAGLAIPDHDEGYAIRVTGNMAAVAARTERGVFNGATTLAQLIQLSPKGVWLRGSEITDYPTLNFRGVQVLGGPHAERDLSRALRELMARFKINTLLFIADHVIWDRHPELEYEGRAMSKAEVQTILDVARENMIEVIPMVQSLGHMYWMFVNDQNLDLAEDPDKPYAYNPTDPRSYELVHGVFEEAVELFKPRYFHIGHDEVTMLGRFPWKSRWTGKSVGQLFAENVQKHHAWFSERGIEVMLWGDMLLSSDVGPDACNAESPEDALLARSMLPRDVIITDWHYAPAKPEEFRSLKLFHDEGFRTIGAGWDIPLNIANLAKACAENDSMGYLQTTWAGWDFKVEGNEPAWKQFWAYILAAEHSWTGENTPLGELSFIPSETFLNVFFRKKPQMQARPGFLVDLSPLANRSLSDNEQKTGWLGYGPGRDFSSFPRGENIFENIRYSVKANEQGHEAVLLAGPFNPPGVYPKEVEITLPKLKASELHFLMNSAFRTRDGVHTADIIVHYEDNSTNVLPLHYGRDLFVPEESRIGQRSRIAWKGTNASGETIQVWGVVWNNPSPEKKITKVVLSSRGTQAAPILYALSGVE